MIEYIRSYNCTFTSNNACVMTSSVSDMYKYKINITVILNMNMLLLLKLYGNHMVMVLCSTAGNSLPKLLLQVILYHYL